MFLRDVDWILALIFLGAGCAIGYRFLVDFGVTNLDQQWMPAAVMWACGQGLHDPASSPPALTAFLKMELPSFDCRDLISVGAADHTNAVINTQLYLGLAAAVSWRLLGVSYLSLSPLLGVLYGAYVAGCFVLLRLFLSRGLAAFAAAILAVSPIAVTMLRHLRDFSKAPFIIWALVLLILAVREHRSNRLAVIAALAGLVVGVGIGFRADVKLVALVGIVILAFGLNRNALTLRTRFAALSIFATISAALGILGSSRATGMGYYAIQGAAEPFTTFLGVIKPSYDVGYRYFDAYSITTIAADLRPQAPDAWDLHEMRVSDVHESYALTRANAYALSWMPLFIGDSVTRGLKSASWIAGYYALFAPKRIGLDPYHLPVSHAYTSVVRLSEPYFSYLSQPWLPYIGLFGCLALVFRSFSRSPREAACIFFILTILLMAPGIQFSARHVFHYEVIFWLGVLSLLSLAFEFNRLRNSLYVFARWLVALVLVGGVGYAGLLLLQHHLLTREILHILDAKREPVATGIADLQYGNKLIEVPTPPAAAKLVGISADGIDADLHETLFTFEHWRISALALADRLLVAVGGRGCPAGKLQLELTYEGPLSFSRSLTVDVLASDEKTLLVTPAFYSRLERFRGIAVSADRVECIGELSKILDGSRLPSSFTVVLAPEWKTEPMFQGLGGF